MEELPFQPAIFTVADVRQHLRKYHVFRGLQCINRASRLVYTNSSGGSPRGTIIEPTATITQWDLAYIAKELIRCSDDLQRGNLCGETGADGLRQALFLTTNMRDPVVNDDVETTPAMITNLVTRLAHKQFPHQGWGEPSLFRTAYMYGHIGRLIAGGIDLDAESQVIFGMPVKVFVALGTALFAAALREGPGTFTRASIEKSEVVRGLTRKHDFTPETWARFWEKVAVDYATFRRRADRRGLDPAYSAFEFNPLLIDPVVWQDGYADPYNAEHVVPSVGALLLRFSDGIYHDFFAKFDNGGSGHYAFTTFFGAMFERYVGEQLREHFGADAVLPERPYWEQGERVMGPDWILIAGNSALVIECSTTRLVMRSKATAEFDLFRRDVVSKLAGMVNLFPEKIRHLRYDRSIWPELATVQHFYPVIVTYDAWWLAPTIMEIIQAEPPPKFDPNLPYHIISVDELENLAAFGRAGLAITPIFEDRIRQGKVGDHLGNTLNAVARARHLEHDQNVILERARQEVFELVTSGIG